MSNVKLSLTRKSGKFHLESTNEDGSSVDTDGSPDIGGQGNGLRPMELLLAGLASCSAIDIVLIMEKQRQQLEDIRIDVNANRVKVGNHSEYSTIHMSFHFYGSIKDEKAQRAIDLSLDEYCSVAQILKKTAKITYDFDINDGHEG
ncbi:MAG: OsmC family protein [Saprospiraceae bacterium]|nr:OsmC family protein [Saprospiraceae bacterium]